MKAFSSHQVCRLAGITYRQIDHWTRTGLLTPEVRPASGSGSQRRYAEWQVLAAFALANVVVPNGSKGRRGPIAENVKTLWEEARGNMTGVKLRLPMGPYSELVIDLGGMQETILNNLMAEAA